MQFLKFAGLWAAVFVPSYLIMSLLGIIPAELTDFNRRLLVVVSRVPLQNSVVATTTVAISNGTSDVVPDSLSVRERILPDRIVIEKIGVDTPVVNPESRDIVVLDKALLSGVVRYPTSGGLEDNSTMFLFGHSTSFRTVHNEAYKAFNRLGELQIGDTIRVSSGSTDYVYKVFSVSEVDKDKALVELQTGEKLLTLSTCDTFGARSDRFVVQARFIQALPSQ
ncbi:MAG: hypothetical protein A3C06_03275 [Candidatus Taylorbacteria bacterium RIFCSPHIGHO2_02_FULL_46_13]|uniref:Sortase n=1 Tax=Candidatus Taylorbacteria bacterium RIFCSPHIGHO2_02_FULL_46_13 TaxID=1802312 RepID=A0A1G2MTL7_9BACT|nr:MAG: hypothetical protein A3C06_03275 [Candidatus Taylorbacteria bacterium RIFCSPHIGHO2_02_FULL_46_13]